MQSENKANEENDTIKKLSDIGGQVPNNFDSNSSQEGLSAEYAKKVLYGEVKSDTEYHFPLDPDDLSRVIVAIENFIRKKNVPAHATQEDIDIVLKPLADVSSTWFAITGNYLMLKEAFLNNSPEAMISALMHTEINNYILGRQQLMMRNVELKYDAKLVDDFIKRAEKNFNDHVAKNGGLKFFTTFKEDKKEDNKEEELGSLLGISLPGFLGRDARKVSDKVEKKSERTFSVKQEFRNSDLPALNDIILKAVNKGYHVDVSYQTAGRAHWVRCDQELEHGKQGASRENTNFIATLLDPKIFGKSTPTITLRMYPTERKMMEKREILEMDEESRTMRP